MMVEPLHALVADAAVPGAIRPDHLTICAQEDWIEHLHHLHEINVFGSLQVAGILAQGDHVQDQGQPEKRQLKIDQRLAIVIHYRNERALVKEVMYGAYLRGKRYSSRIL